MHLCLVTETYPPEINGVAMTLSRLVAGLRARGHRVTVIRPRPAAGGLPRPTDPDEVDVPGFPLPGYSLLRLGWPCGKRLKQSWRTDRPDVVHIATEGPLGWSALSAAAALGLPVTSTFHTNFHHYSRDYGVGVLLRPVLAYLRAFHNRTRVTLAPTAALAGDLSLAGFRGVGVLGRGVDIELFHPGRRDVTWRRQQGFADDDLVVVHVSRLAKEKNYALLERAFWALQEENASARLLIVSDGPERRRLERRLPDARFTGFLTPERLATAYASSDVFLYPSLSETFGNVLLEAMASGLPCLAFDYAAAGRYVTSEINGLKSPEGDEANFIAQAVRLAKTPALRQRLGPAARATTETIPWSQVIQHFEAVLLAQPHRPSPVGSP